MKYVKSEDAVSPVIGVILMVAITVILAAVIAAFVFGMAGGVSKTKTVAATAKQDGTAYVVTWQGGADNTYTLGYNVTADCNNPDEADCVAAGIGTPIIYPGCLDCLYQPVVGNSTRVPGATGANDHVIVVASFTDGSQQVVLDTYA
jgi:flagellin-like protein